jgi:hypothetical protein
MGRVRPYDASLRRSRVGFPAEQTEQYDDGTTVLQVAAVHEFGAPSRNIPIRAFVRPSFDEGIDKLQKHADKMLLSVADGKRTPEQAIAALGAFHAGQMKDKVKKGPFAPLKQQTILNKNRRIIGRKGTEGFAMNSTPLIDTGEMIQSITHIED